ncbi:unnamed protein product [Penicillium salamii]|uniref:Uncharacterized protein n=1 Tax=Penicillium salamii TaxID=1612424 RepID=A0A9W4IU96_9EURO|nr:unnamed protein product [Penicillium salamii]CAG8295396.1 unnamed protein product [Penicillium salamii]CAG8346546.1 unnamed protein product [Penicillium salamii]CAG8348512.1 unnamed protein product [Penicillium salamii]CAG8353241.1 unnamed protein product [Penicillium salamii]
MDSRRQSSSRHQSSSRRSASRHRSSSHSGPSSHAQGSGTSSQIIAPGLGDHLSNNPSRYVFGWHQLQGALRQRWLQDANTPCPIEPKQPASLMRLVNHRNPSQRWHIEISHFDPPPAGFVNEVARQGFPHGSHAYRKIRVEGPEPQNPDLEPNEYCHLTAKGVIFAMDINRTDGMHWSDVAVSQYVMDNPIDTLRSIYFHDVINLDTKRFFTEELYPQRIGMRFDARDNYEAEQPMTWSFGTPEYQGILGTTFGKGVCALLATYFPRGTVSIARIVSWKYADLQIRFDIEPTLYMEGLAL